MLPDKSSWVSHYWSAINAQNLDLSIWSLSVTQKGARKMGYKSGEVLLGKRVRQVQSTYPWPSLGTRATFKLSHSRITADGDCSHEIKRRLLLGRKVMTNIDSILKSRDITLPTKVHLVKAMVFPVVMYGCESWTVKKAEHGRIDAFEL